MKKVIIDFTGAKYYHDLYQIIKDSFKNSMVYGYPDFAGENADALWDCLTGFIERPVEITIKGRLNVAKDLKEEVDKIMEIFQMSSEKKRLGIAVIISDCNF